MSKYKCTKCGQAFDPQKDIRVVNSKRGYALPEPEHCSQCWQVKQEQKAIIQYLNRS